MSTSANLKITVSPLLQILGGENAEFRGSPDKLLLVTRKHGPEEIDIDSIALPNALHTGFIFSHINLQTKSGTRRIRCLRKKQAVEAFRWLQAYYCRRIAPAVRHDAERVLQILSKGYLRHSRANKIKDITTPYSSILSTLPDFGMVEPDEKRHFEIVHKYSGLSQSSIDAYNRQYIEKQEKEFAEFFDTIESNPLTKNQRLSCIIDEDNNLVLAGAGTGKTSAMIGRTGYLLKSGLAGPHQILMLAFANKAAGEMQERLDERLGVTGIVASTFHKLGKDIIARVEGAQPSVAPIAEDEKLLTKKVDEWFSAHMEGSAYRERMLRYFENYLYPEENLFDFATEGEYFDYILANEIRTLKGEAVKSLGECLIANHLFTLGIEYQYEADYEHSTQDIHYRQYQPDFYLPEHGIYIEHLGIDRDGNTPSYVDRELYHIGIKWKRELHAEHGTCLIETFYYEQKEGRLLSELERKLIEQGVAFDRLPPESVLTTLKDFGAISAFSILLAQLLRRYKANHFSEAQLQDVINSSANPAQIHAALELLMPVYADYEEHLAKTEQIDFDDMIGKALAYVESGRFQSNWKYILVDEFQDISNPRARLVTALRNSVADSSLFCVGDDWQAIYRFTGSDIGYTTSFARIFGTTATTVLNQTFRFNDSICNISSRFVQENPLQVRKTLSTLTKVKRPAVSLLRANTTANDHAPYDPRLRQVLSSISKIAGQNATVYLLARFRFSLPDGRQLRTIQNDFPNLDIACLSTHASKGKEADYVVLLGLERGKHGFPSRKVTNPLLEALLPGLDNFPYAEERRLFYVALTRARRRAYLICDMAVASEFVIELLDNKYPLELNEFHTTLAQKLFQAINCYRCGTGVMVARTGTHGQFFGCSHYPLCDNTESGCKSCGNAMTRKGRFKVCINPDCDSWLPVCPACGGDMVQRKGNSGVFWGCRNYRQNEKNSCDHTESSISYSPAAVEMH